MIDELVECTKQIGVDGDPETDQTVSGHSSTFF
jgi:hypothetical protein